MARIIGTRVLDRTKTSRNTKHLTHSSPENASESVSHAPVELRLRFPCLLDKATRVLQAHL